MKSRGVEEYKAQIRCFIRKESKEEEQSAWLRLHTSVKGYTDTVASPVHRLFSSLTISESVVQNIITASSYPKEEEERMKIMKGLCLVMVKRERERTRTWMLLLLLLLLLWVEKTELEMIIGNESNSETEIVSSESGKASQ